MKTKMKTDLHHRLPRLQNGTDTFPENNLVVVPKKRHAHWHALFSGNRTLESIVQELNNVWIDPRYEIFIKEKEIPIKGQLSLF